MNQYENDYFNWSQLWSETILINLALIPGFLHPFCVNICVDFYFTFFPRASLIAKWSFNNNLAIWSLLLDK